MTSRPNGKELRTSKKVRRTVARDPRSWWVPGPINGDPPLPEGAVYWFDSRDVDGSDNGSLSDGDPISAWVNQGSGADGQQLTAGNRPTIAKGVGPNSIDVVQVDGGADSCIELTGSASAGSFIANGTYEAWFVMRNNVAGSSSPRPFGSTYYGGVSGVNMRWNVPYCQWRIFDDVGTANLVVDSTNLFPTETWNAVTMYGNGTNQYQANNLIDYTSAAIASAGTGADPYSIFWGAYNNVGTPAVGMSGYLALLLLYDKVLTSDERDMVKTFINTIYGL